jgi:hypothetical protein
LDELTDKRVHGDHTLGLEFAEWHVNGPLIGAQGTETVLAQINAFADADAGVTNQEEEIRPQIVAPEQLLLEQLILLGRESTWQLFRQTGDILAPEQMSQVGLLFHDGQFGQDTAHTDEQQDAVGGGERRCLGAEVGQPTEDVWITA